MDEIEFEWGIDTYRVDKVDTIRSNGLIMLNGKAMLLRPSTDPTKWIVVEGEVPLPEAYKFKC